MTVTSLSASKNTCCKTHPLCINPCVPFWTCEKTHKLRAQWHADVTVVVEVRQSKVQHNFGCRCPDRHYGRNQPKQTCRLQGSIFQVLGNHPRVKEPETSFLIYVILKTSLLSHCEKSHISPTFHRQWRAQRIESGGASFSNFKSPKCTSPNLTYKTKKTFRFQFKILYKKNQNSNF